MIPNSAQAQARCREARTRPWHHEVIAGLLGSLLSLVFCDFMCWVFILAPHHVFCGLPLVENRGEKK